MDIYIPTINKLILDYFPQKLASKVSLLPPPDITFGHLSTNIAIVEANKLKQDPLDVANKIVTSLYKKIDTNIIAKVEVIKPGFINFHLTTDFLLKQSEIINYKISYSQKLASYGRGKTLVIDYSAPNIAKPFGIGHLRSTNIGQAIYNLYQTLGWNCIGDNHLGDWGTQFGKLIVAINKWSKKPVDKLTIKDLERLYVKFHHQAEIDSSLIEQARLIFKKLEDNDPAIKKIWQTCVDISLSEFNRVYDILGVKIDYSYGESFYQDKLNQVIKLFIDKKLTKISQGATIVELASLPPAMLVKSDGSTTYFTRDLATVSYRLHTWKPDLIIYEVGADQTLHFQQVFSACQQVGWSPKFGFVHVAHGLIRWSTGKFSTRQGNTIHLADVITKARQTAKKIVSQIKISKNLDPTNRQQMITNVAIGAIKFADLFQHPSKDIIFDWGKVMGLSGNSGPYLQYTYARCLSVLEKSAIKETKNLSVSSLTDLPLPVENNLLSLFVQFESKIIESALTFNPSLLTQYLIKLAQTYNEFYASTKIIKSSQQTFRLFLCQTTASILYRGLKILGIVPIEKM